MFSGSTNIIIQMKSLSSTQMIASMLPSSQMITPNVKKNVIIQSDNKINVIIQQHDKNKYQGKLSTSQISCYRTAEGAGQRAPSLRPHGGGTPLPTPGSGEGDVITPAFRGMAGTTVTSLLRGTGGFSPNHLSESLNPIIQIGGPRRGRLFCRRLHQWRRWHGSWNVEMTSYVYVFASEYVTARLWLTLRKTSATPCGPGYGDTTRSGFS